MTRIGVTGHQGLPQAALPYINTHVREILQEQDRPLIGYTSLAEGADQLVAVEILKAGGQIHAVIPSRHYDSTFEGIAAVEYQRLLGSAMERTELPFAEPSEEAYDAAGRWVAEQCDLLIAIWDGQPARGLGGTADAVAHARELSKDVHVIWPQGVARD